MPMGEVERGEYQVMWDPVNYVMFFVRDAIAKVCELQRDIYSVGMYCQWSTNDDTVSLTIPSCPGTSQPKATHVRVFITFRCSKE